MKRYTAFGSGTDETGGVPGGMPGGIIGGTPGGTGVVPGGLLGVPGGVPGVKIDGITGTAGPKATKGGISDGITLMGGKTGCSRSIFTGGMADSSPRGGLSASSIGRPNCMGGINSALSGGSWLLTGVCGFSERRLPQRARA